MSKKGMTGQSSYEFIIPLTGNPRQRPPGSEKSTKIANRKSRVLVKTRYGWLSKQELYGHLNATRAKVEEVMVTYNLQNYDDLFDLNLFNRVKP